MPTLLSFRTSTTPLVAVLLLASLLTGCSHAPSPAKAASSVAAAAAAREKALAQERAAAAARDASRQQVDSIPLPAKNVYMAIHTRQSWANPFLIVGKSTVNLSMMYPPSGPASSPGDTLLRPAAARRRELDLRLSDLTEALTALPPEAWTYGRVIAVEEDPTAPRADRVAVRRNVEATMQILSDLGIVVYEWPQNGLR
ncbi:MAG TPA: hypothetical protein VHX60_13275 [Acidobacteriaceae bacterium]|jgi:hypothetical protein|nr:hypothetical protein [Acidobacteriaceae bacterium]